MDQASILVRRARAALPGVWSCCQTDVRDLVEDIVAVAHPRLYHRIATPRAVGLPAPAGVASSAGKLVATAGERRPGTREKLAGALRGVAGDSSSEAASTPAWRRLQRRYLDGRITLEQYVAEAGRLRGGAT